MPRTRLTITVMKALLCTLSVCSAFQVPLGKPHLDRTAAAPLIPAGLSWMPTAAHAMDFNELSSWGEKPLIVDGPGGSEVNPLCYLIIVMVGAYQYLPKPNRGKPAEKEDSVMASTEEEPPPTVERSSTAKMMAAGDDEEGPRGLAAFAQNIARAARPPPNPPKPSKQEMEEFQARPPSLGKFFQGFAMAARYRRLESTEESYGNSNPKGKKK